MEKETSRLSENLGKYSGRCLGAGRPISQKATFEQVSERGIRVLQVDHRRKSLLVSSQWYERAGRWQAGVRCGRGLAVSSKDGHLGWGQIAKYEYPAKTLGLYSVSREWVKRSMLDSVGEDTWSRGWGEPGHRRKLYGVWGVKQDGKGPMDSILARTRRMRYTSSYLQPIGKHMGSPVLVL